MADRDWVAFWAEQGKTLNADNLVPGNGFVPPFSLERAESLGLTVDGDDLSGESVAGEMPEASTEDDEAADEAVDASEDEAESAGPV